MNQTLFTLRPWSIHDLDNLVKHANNPNIAQFMTDAFPHPDATPDQIWDWRSRVIVIQKQIGAYERTIANTPIVTGKQIGRASCRERV